MFGGFPMILHVMGLSGTLLKNRVWDVHHLFYIFYNATLNKVWNMRYNNVLAVKNVKNI